MREQSPRFASLNTGDDVIRIPAFDFQTAVSDLAGLSIFVMPALVAGIHVLSLSATRKTWIAGTKGVHARLRQAMPGDDDRVDRAEFLIRFSNSRPRSRG